MTRRTRIHLVRHGEVVPAHRYNGHRDVPLSEKGIEQYRSLKPRLAGCALSACYTSDLKRCMDGGEILTCDLGLSPVTVPALREVHVGEWEGMSLKELQESRPQEVAARMADMMGFRFPGGETFLELAERVRPALREIVERHRGEEVLVVAHGGVNRVVLLDAVGAPLSALFNIAQDYGCLNVIDYYEDGITVVQLLNG